MTGYMYPGFKRPEGVGRLGLDRGGAEFAVMMGGIIGRWVPAGQLKGFPAKIISEALEGVGEAVTRMYNGQVKEKKFCVQSGRCAKSEGR